MIQNFIIGTYSQNGIYMLQFHNGSFSLLNKLDAFENCSSLCYSKNNIYGIIEYSERNRYQNGALISVSSNFLDNQAFSILGKGPCFILLDDLRNLLYIANYGDGTIDVFLLDNTGCVISPIYHKTFTSHSRIHHIAFSEDKSTLFVTDLGDNKLYAYKIIFENQTLDLKEFSIYTFSAHTAPRHLAIYADNIYVITENSCELYHFTFSESFGFHLVNCVSIMNGNKTIHDTGCAIRISEDGQFIYTSIRGKDCINVFTASPELKQIQSISCFGKTPRDIQFDITQNYLFCANQNSETICIFKRNGKTGLLQYETLYHIDNPAYILPYEI